MEDTAVLRRRPEANCRPAGALSGVGSARPRPWPSGGTRATPGRASCPPLSSGHISPHRRQEFDKTQPFVEFAKGGNVSGVRIPSGPQKGVPHVDRQEIKGFSFKSRTRLLRLVNSVDQTACKAGDFVFITQTYPKEFPSARASKRDLDTFIKRFERKYDRPWLVWKLEPQRRGAPHYHLLVWLPGVRDDELVRFVATCWHDIAGRGDRNHLAWHLGKLGNKPCVERVRDFAGVSRYAGKYLGKPTGGDEEWQHQGRYWGERRHEKAPITWVRKNLPRREAVRVRRTLVKCFEHQPPVKFYFCGRNSCNGRFLPGWILYGREKWGKDEYGRERLVKDCYQEIAGICERKVRPVRRRWPRSGGGIQMFLSEAEMKRIIEWAFET